MNVKQGYHEDLLTNVLIKSKSAIEQIVKNDSKLNYKKRYDNPKQLEVSYVDALANLEQINQLFKKRINQKNKHYNFFLDDSQDPSVENAISPQLFRGYKQYASKGKIFAYNLRTTWTKGKQFFFIEKGTVMEIKHIYDDRIFVDVLYKGMIGLMKHQEIKIILTENDQSD